MRLRTSTLTGAALDWAVDVPDEDAPKRPGTPPHRTAGPDIPARRE